MHHVTFSVIIPCYRAGATIGIALQSLVAQTDQDFEVIVVEDGCPDLSGQEGLRAIGAGLNARLIRQRQAGPSAARNAGARAANGMILAFLDSDDQWAPDCLACHRAAFAGDRQLGISFARVRFCDKHLVWGGRVSGITGPLGLVDALGDNPTCTTSNMVVRRDAFEDTGGFDATLTHAEDQDLVVRVLAGGIWHVRGLDAQLVDYRMSEHGLSAELDRMHAGWLAMLARARAIAPEEIAHAERPARARFYRYLARRALRTGRPAHEALRLFCRALATSPAALLRNQPRRSVQTGLGIVAALLLPDRFIRPIVAR